MVVIIKYNILQTENLKAKTVNVKASKTKVTIKRLKSKKKYFVRARIYRKVKINGKLRKYILPGLKQKNQNKIVEYRE